MTTATAMATDTPSAFGIKLYRAVWRWHFYAGLIVVPFLTFLALTGLIMLYGNSVDTFLGPKYHVASGGERASAIAQALAAEQAVPGGKVSLFVSPARDDIASYFIVKADKAQTVVVVEPHGPKILASYSRDNTWFNWASGLHGTMWIGDIGDRILEATAGLGIILVITGCYLWWRAMVAALPARYSRASRLRAGRCGASCTNPSAFGYPLFCCSSSSPACHGPAYGALNMCKPGARFPAPNLIMCLCQTRPWQR